MTPPTPTQSDDVWLAVKQRLVEVLPDIPDVTEEEYRNLLHPHQLDIHLSLRRINELTAALAAERRKVERLKEALQGIAKETHPALVMSLSDAYAYKVAVGIARAALQDEQQGETA